MQFHPNELTILFDPSSSVGKKFKAYAHSISKNVNEIDYTKTRLTTTLWKKVVKMLGNNPSKLLNKSHKEYKSKVSGNTFTMHGWLNILLNSPDMLRGPIAITKDKAVMCENPSDILKLGRSTNVPSRKLPHLTR